MGVWSSGPDPTKVDIPGIAAEMRPVLYEWFSGRIQIIDPKREGMGDYDPYADSRDGVTPPGLVLDSGVDGALIQPIRSPTRIDVGAQPNAVLGVRFQLKREPGAIGDLRGGLLVKVLDGGESSDLARYRFSLTEAVDSSLAWGRIYDAVLIAGGLK